MKSNWNYPTTVWVGKDRIKDLGEACNNLKINKKKIPLMISLFKAILNNRKLTVT